MKPDEANKRRPSAQNGRAPACQLSRRPIDGVLLPLSDRAMFANFGFEKVRLMIVERMSIESA